MCLIWSGTRVRFSRTASICIHRFMKLLWFSLCNHLKLQLLLLSPNSSVFPQSLQRRDEVCGRLHGPVYVEDRARRFGGAPEGRPLHPCLPLRRPGLPARSVIHSSNSPYNPIFQRLLHILSSCPLYDPVFQEKLSSIPVGFLTSSSKVSHPF